MSLNTNDMKQTVGNTLGYPWVGTHLARLIGVVDLGVQDRQAYQGKPKSPCGQVLFTYELTDDLVEINGEEKPRWISKKENAFSGQNSNITQLVSNLDPSNQFGGDLSAMARASVTCMVTIAQKTDKTSQQPIEGVRITSITSCPPSIPVFTAQNPPLVFDWDKPDMQAYDRLPNWVQEVIKKAHNFNQSNLPALVAAYDAQKAAQEAQQAAGSGQTGGQGQNVGQSTNPAPNPAPTTSQAAPAQNVPTAPPGYYWDQASNAYKPLAEKKPEPAAAAPAPDAPPGWKLVNGQWVQDNPQTPAPQTNAAPAGGRPY